MLVSLRQIKADKNERPSFNDFQNSKVKDKRPLTLIDQINQAQSAILKIVFLNGGYLP